MYRKRNLAAKAHVLDDFQKSRDILLRIRQSGELSTSRVPEDWIDDKTAAAIDPSQRTYTEAGLAKFLQPLPAKSLNDALKTFEAVDGFYLEPGRLHHKS
jgi:hypothetical protein